MLLTRFQISNPNWTFSKLTLPDITVLMPRALRLSLAVSTPAVGSEHDVDIQNVRMETEFELVSAISQFEPICGV
jgi:hypothetical protein